jgi:hypothetical protein
MKKNILAFSVAAAFSTQAGAFQVVATDDWDIRWDNTFKGNLMFRTEAINKDVVTDRRGASWFLADDSDLSVDRSNLGIASARIDLLSEVDVIWRDNFGFRVSASGWYDAAYANSDHPSDRQLSWANPSVDVGDYSDEAEDMHYFGGELLDAFVFANWDIGDTAWGARFGRHTIYWGNSLLTFGAIHGVGSAMAPLDFNKALSVPGSEAKELFMPTNKFSTVVQLTDNLTFNAYYNFEHQAFRLPEDGTYFSPAEGLTEESEFITLIPGDPFRVGVKGDGFEDDDGDWGINFQYYVEPWGLETSFIYLNYVDKNLNGLMGGIEFDQFVALQALQGDPASGFLLNTWLTACGQGLLECPNLPVFEGDTGTVTIGSGKWLFKNDIDLYAISLAKEQWGISFGADIVLRKNAGLAPELGASLQRVYGIPDVFEPLVPAQDWDYQGADSDNYFAPVGDVWSITLNALGFLSDNGLWEGGSYIFETTFSMLDDCTEYCDLLDVRVKEDSVLATAQVIFRPTWYQVLPGWDMTLPVSVAYAFGGEKAEVSFGGDDKSGTASVGVDLDINQTWRVQANYNVRFGPVLAGIGGLLKDRDNFTITVKRTF